MGNAQSGDVAGYFQVLGEGVERAWSQNARRPLSFAESAASALSQFPPPRWTIDDLVRGIVGVRQLPTQAALDLAFGQPPVTMFWDDAFRIDVLFWRHATVGIHQHRFAGAFTLLSGSSVESRYRFTPIDESDAAVRFGHVELTDAELLGPGDVQPIPYGDDLVHSVVHLDTPTVTLVVRTPQDREHGSEYEYKPPFLAIDPSHASPTAIKRVQLLGMLLRTCPDEYAATAETALAGADLHATYRILEQARFHASEMAFDRLVEMAGAGDERVEQYFRPVLDDQLRRQLLLNRRPSLSDWNHRFLLALLVNLPDRHGLERIVARRYPEEDPVALVERWVAELSGVDGIG